MKRTRTELIKALRDRTTANVTHGERGWYHNSEDVDKNLLTMACKLDDISEALAVILAEQRP